MLSLSPQGSRAAADSAARTSLGQAGPWVKARLLRTALLGLGLRWGIAGSYVDPETPTEALLSAGRRLPIVEGGIQARDFFFHHLDDIALPRVIFFKI